MQKDTFWDMERNTIITGKGAIEMPIFYYDISSVMQTFFVKPDNVRELLMGTGLEPCVFINGKALVVLVFFEYRNSSLGPYNEVGLCSFTHSKYLKKPKLYLPNFLTRGENWDIAAHVHDLPVSTEIACTAGQQIYGYPKFTADIPFSLSPNSFQGAVMDPDSDNEIMSIGGKRGLLGPGIMFRGMDMVTYSLRKNKQLRTVITVDGKAKYNLFPPMRLKVGQSNHRMARNLRTLDLHNARPTALITTYKGRSILPEGSPVSPVQKAKMPVGVS